MADYSEKEKEALRSVPIGTVLGVLGHDTSHGRSNMYFSPFRKERLPSFHVDPVRNIWYDFGTGESGSVLTLVRKLLGCNGGQAYDYLASLDPSSISVPRMSEERPGIPGITLTGTCAGFSRHLLSYAATRGITEQTLARWCSCIEYTTASNPGRHYRAIGMKNDSGGWVLRSPAFKGCTCSDITTFAADGQDGGDTGIRPALVFEGFFDFLAYSQLHDGTWPACDICILNSTVNVRKAIGWTARHREVHLMLDDDRAGREASRDFADAFCTQSDITIDDWSAPYRGRKDLSAMYAEGEEQRTLLSTQYRSLWNRTSQPRFRRD